MLPVSIHEHGELDPEDAGEGWAHHGAGHGSLGEAAHEEVHVGDGLVLGPEQGPALLLDVLRLLVEAGEFAEAALLPDRGVAGDPVVAASLDVDADQVVASARSRLINVR